MDAGAALTFGVMLSDVGVIFCAWSNRRTTRMALACGFGRKPSNGDPVLSAEFVAVKYCLQSKILNLAVVGEGRNIEQKIANASESSVADDTSRV